MSMVGLLEDVYEVSTRGFHSGTLNTIEVGLHGLHYICCIIDGESTQDLRWRMQAGKEL